MYWSEICTYKAPSPQANTSCTCNLCQWETNNSVKKPADSSRTSESESHNLWCHLRCSPPLQTSQSSPCWTQWPRNPAGKPNPTSGTAAVQHLRAWAFLNASLAVVQRARGTAFRPAALRPQHSRSRHRGAALLWPIYVPPASAAETPKGSSDFVPTQAKKYLGLSSK